MLREGARGGRLRPGCWGRLDRRGRPDRLPPPPRPGPSHPRVDEIVASRLDAMEMEYRRVGRAGLQVSVLSFGSWVTFGPQLDEGLGADCLAAAYDAGVNFFDNAEGYE